MKAEFLPYQLDFLRPSRTSRAVMKVKDTYFLKIYDESDPSHFGVGECAVFRGLSADDSPQYEVKLRDLCAAIEEGRKIDISRWPSIKFGLETALLDFENGCCRRPFPTPWSEGHGGIMINGLVWMDTPEVMLGNALAKAEAGFRCIKLKIGAHDFEKELEMVDRLRLAFGPDRLEIRLDANGAFADPEVAVSRLKRLSVLDIHSLEQPVKAGRWDQMAYVCENSPIDIALDEELIGIFDPIDMEKMLRYISPRYLILKPSLCGGFSGATDWIQAAEKLGIGWWATSALESNVGLNSIAQWTSALDVTMPQGLGTGMLYSNNIPSPLWLDGQMLRYDPTKTFDLPSF
ncbi:MAG: o-succinylbenzoate synthase [Bacteroides sp.]|nr:o-succinylbenzoate synthase [Bacteroides sp.]